MRIFKKIFLPLMIAVMALSFQACKTKKIAAQPAQEPAVVTEKVEEKAEPVVTEEKKEEPVSIEDNPDFNFSNIQFEFNSAVLKTSSYPVLDKIASEMKKYPEAKFIINGHSSAEGTEEHNKSLSVDRAVSVKTFLVNAGVNSENLQTVGYGESKPITTNDTEEGRAQNRRVEIKNDK
ncbi:OmpA family protein [Rubrolithibacter danxiaensis]|uniref:OmpA family protein n=1 Tax=Rubrolithibacter danxiaensis TaxID=3390805 RepID=UPI003BF9111A